ncbi:uncharacterized protein TRAVEDRAFT_46378 [Trametes versicolor FP-101664 SS1]|uniref:uncharacterized protein n=1 Tax=Trametes versicolor (strain FP-101664) TaxID=717944 RepID=UPI0004622E91|nr:uncharacterized protein TRAVEDRAFT_46378 [Trametes versicolor FP-101664 SS1]EIW59068.1 hypothetical protein TRAVEDRAFT_46378 [Trametes versicolor FP-101664 SS1]
MPLRTFINLAFKPQACDDRDGLLSFRHAFKAVPQTAGSAAQIYEPLAAALNKTSKYKARCPGLVFEKTIERSLYPLRSGSAKPHICCFTPEHAELVRRADKHTRVEFGYAELFINVSPKPSYDFFVDPPTGADQQDREAHEFVRQFDTEDWDLLDLSCRAESAFGLQIAFATEVFARQHRLVVYSIAMAGSFARILRWDRGGCIVTEAFDVREHPELLLEFIWRFSQVSAIERGHDPTVSIATPQEETRFRDAVIAHVRSQLEVEGDELDRAVRAHYQPGHVTAVDVYFRAPMGTVVPVSFARRFVVSRPVVSPLYLESRGTRGYWALCCDTGRVVFLKDSWREHSTTELEGDILERLNDLGVRNVPLLVAHGDVPEEDDTFQKTGPLFVGQPWRCLIDGEDNDISRRQHYRLVTDTAGYGLNTVRGTRELLHATYDTFTAMRDALAKDSRIHRDLSVGNIILVKEPGSAIRRGYLIDWEASDQVDEGGDAKDAGRAGTWDFMSIRMLSDSGMDAKHTFKDDMEALLYVVFYCALLYTPHDVRKDKLHISVHAFFRSHARLGDVTFGGGWKMDNAHSRLFTGNIQFQSAALQEWIATVADFHSPPPSLEEKYKDAWDAAHLDAFWSEFLQTRVLENDDRVVHKLVNPDRRSLPAFPPAAPPSAGPASRKHHVSPPGDTDVDTPAPKKRRTELQKAPAASHISPVRTRRGRLLAASAPRRSERIRARLNQQKPSAAFSRASGPAPSGRIPPLPRKMREAEIEAL